jgi:SOS-response transcriptional repressor LexA
MGFARAVDHLDGDELSITDLLVPRPKASFIYHVKDAQLADASILTGDIVVVERGRPLGRGRIALVSVDGELRLVRVLRNGRQFVFDGISAFEESVQLVGIASRVIRPLVPYQP